MEEEGDKILKPLFLVTDPWLWALIWYKPLGAPWWGAQFLRHEPTVFPSLPTENENHLFISPTLCIFFIQLRSAEKAKISASNNNCCTNLHSHQQCKGSLLPTCTSTLLCCLFANSCSERYKVISPGGFDLNFLDDQQPWVSFHVSVGHLYVLEIKCLFRSSAHLKIWYWNFFFFGCWIVWVPASGTYNSQNCKLKVV